MKGPVLSAWIAAGLVLAASGARAQQADCDLVCRLQGYLSTDHMAAGSGGAASSSAAAPVKHHPHAAATAPKPGPKVAIKAEPAVDAKAPAKPSAKTAAKAPAKTVAAVEPATVPEPDLPKAAASAKPQPAKGPKSVAPARHPTNLDSGTTEPPKRHVIAAIATPSGPLPGPAAVAPLPRHRRNASAASRLAHKPASHPVASADLIPGSARLVPAGFQTFGNL